MRFPKKLRALWRRRQLDRDLDDELRFHLEMSAAPRQFGNVASIREHCRDLWTFAPLETLWHDARYAARTLAKTPAFAGIAGCAIPARRAIRVDPASVLRCE